MPRRHRPTVVHPMALRELRVLRIADVTPGLRRVTLTGEQLGAFTHVEGAELPAFVSTGFDDDVRLYFAAPGAQVPVLPTYVDGAWVMPKDPRPIGRYYTVRRFDPVTRELDLDFVHHGVGAGTTWANRAKPGDTLHVAGPTASMGLPEGVDWLFVVGDDTATPAISRLLEELPDDARAQAFLEVADESHRYPLAERAGVEVTWLTRAASEDGGSRLLEAVRSAPWWDGSVFAWVAGEQSVVRDVRRHLVEERGVPKQDIDFVGYWKRSEALVVAEDPALPDPTQAPAWEKFHEQAELLPPLAIRLAVDLGIGDLISRGVRTPAELAARTGTLEWTLRKFLRYLETIELLESHGDEYALTETGEYLAEQFVIDFLKPQSVWAQFERGFGGIKESLVTGRASFASVIGQDFETLREDPAFEKEYLDGIAQYAAYLAESLAATQALRDVEHLVVHGDVAGAIAAAVSARFPELRLTLAALPSQATWLRDDVLHAVSDPVRRDRITVVDPAEVPSTDAVLVVDRLMFLPDAEAVSWLRDLAEHLTPGGRLLVFQDSLNLNDLDDHGAEADLLKLALHGSGHRTGAEIEALIAQAGLTVAAVEPVASGDVLRTVVQS